MYQTGLKSVLGGLLLFLATAVQGQVTLAWNPSPGAVTNYTVFWGTNTGVYVFSAAVGNQTNLVVTGLNPGTTYYFAVDATATDGTESPFSSEITYVAPIGTNSPPGSTNSGGDLGSSGSTVTNPPPPPSVTGTNSGSGGSTGSVGSTGSTGSTSSNPTGSNAVSTTVSEFPVPGVPPFLTVGITNVNRPLLGIAGTVGATLMVQSSTNPLNPDSWVTITNLPITAANTNLQANSAAPSALTTAFVPATQAYEVIDTNPPPSEFYRVVMPYDYMVLADSVLSGSGYPSRLVLVRMPGVASDDVCYVTPQSSFLFYDPANNAFAVEPSGSTIRQIATTLSGSLGQNWTSASEFAYSNGVSTILATVVETEPPSSDPVAGASAASIQIDF